MRAPFTGFERVYRRELPFVWAAARRLGVHPAALDDAVQDVFLTAYRRWGDLHYEVSPRAWLYGVTRRVAFRYRRSEARTVRRKAAVARAGEPRPVAPQGERDEAHDVDAVLAVLEPKRREVFVMAELLDMSGPEIAAELQIPVDTVYSRLRLARRQLEPRLRRGVAAWAGTVKKREQPAPEQVQRGWVVLLPLLGQPPGGVIGAWAVGRLVGVVAAGVVAAVAIAGRLPSGDGATRARAGEVVADAVAEPVVSHAALPPSEPSEPSEPIEPEAAADEPVALQAPAKPVAAPSRSSSASARSPVPSLVPPDPPPSAGLEAEVEVLDRASAALRAGEAARALQWLAEHELQFPMGRLTDVRKATRVRALCRLGRDAQARAEAAALRREHPGSAVAQRTPLSCEDA